MAQRVSLRVLAELWNLTESRIRDFSADGRILRGADGLYDLDACMAFRKSRVSKFQAQTLLQSYNNGNSKTDPKLLSKPKLTVDDILGTAPVPEMTLDDLLGPDPRSPPAPPGAEKSETLAQTTDMAAARSQELHDLRVGKAREDLERARVRREVEAGRFTDKLKVQKAALKASSLQMVIFSALPSQIAALYPDPEGKSEVRRRVETAIDQAQHAYWTALKEVGCGLE